MELYKCISCEKEYELQAICFEQRLIEDTEFCPRCWKELIFVEEELEFTM